MVPGERRLFDVPEQQLEHIIADRGRVRMAWPGSKQLQACCSVLAGGMLVKCMTRRVPVRQGANTCRRCCAVVRESAFLQAAVPSASSASLGMTP